MVDNEFEVKSLKITMPTNTFWIEISRESFLDAIQRLKPERMLKSYLSKELEISYSKGEAIFSVNGAQIKQPANGSWKGTVSFKYSYGLNFTKVKPTTDPVRIEFADEKLKIETSRIPATWKIVWEDRK